MADRQASKRQHLRTEICMRKRVAVEMVAADGVMEKPEEWAFAYSNGEME